MANCDFESGVSIQQIRDRLVEELNPRRVVLFGSHANGTASQESDVDLLIEMDTDDPYPERIRKISALFRPRNWALDAFVFTPAEVAEARSINGTLINLVEREGRVLYERR